MIKASDPDWDNNGRVHYDLDHHYHDSKYFTVDKGTGEITLKKRASEIVRESKGRKEFNFMVCVS